MLSKVKYFVKEHPISSIGIGVVVILLLFGLCSCSPGVIHASNGEEDSYQINNAVYMPVAGVYEITRGTEQVIDASGTDKKDLTGFVFPVSQNTFIIEALSCLSYIKEGGFVGCGGSKSYTFDGQFGAIQSATSGAMIFHEDETMEMKIEISGAYVEYDYSFTIHYDLEAKLRHFDNRGKTCPLGDCGQ